MCLCVEPKITIKTFQNFFLPFILYNLSLSFGIFSHCTYLFLVLFRFLFKWGAISCLIIYLLSIVFIIEYITISKYSIRICHFSKHFAIISYDLPFVSGIKIKTNKADNNEKPLNNIKQPCNAITPRRYGYAKLVKNPRLHIFMHKNVIMIVRIWVIKCTYENIK